MSLTDEIYKDIIIDHYQNPRNYGVLENPQIHEHGINPLCGDEFELFINLEDDKISDIKIKGKGCSISQASASMMSELVMGKSLKQIQEFIKLFKGLILETDAMDLPEEMEELKSLSGVKKYPVRVKCAVLSWNTLEKALERFNA